uniref:Uncharacterized protein n=1 Tax=Daphnia galeata TaxID=27404 RepID=A0A8J2RA36_9CRUS|nr:unnamed protein product [Daphnia galeata]
MLIAGDSDRWTLTDGNIPRDFIDAYVDEAKQQSAGSKNPSTTSTYNQLIASVQDLITGGSETTANSIDQNENHIPFGADKRIMCMGEPWTRNSCFFFTSALVKTFHFSANIPGQPLPTLEPVVGFTSAYDHDGFKALLQENRKVVVFFTLGEGPEYIPNEASTGRSGDVSYIKIPAAVAVSSEEMDDNNDTDDSNDINTIYTPLQRTLPQLLSRLPLTPLQPIIKLLILNQPI